ncbi:hypothetical protein FM076_12250 [Streptomyces albus subsp. chlorinus]|uniref:hypothetical protein n=1 Tax=Streptomyces albus TaxID=1888 RepID=UPI00156DE288|nr:hypothetical protein [Streptomyces albus]NSC21927.1 hypothetical protein [Streptomyces albus subsp. chlorinus]
MPRPNAAQLAYGSATVVCSTLAMLLLSQARSGAWIAVIAVAALALGLLVALAVPPVHATLRQRGAVGRVTAPSAALPDPVAAQRPAASASASATPAGMGARR